jgi:putative CocE/NonD family hydrolase
MGPAAGQDYDGLVLRWMDRWVKGLDNGVDREPPARVYVMGASQWRTGDRWPFTGTTSKTLYLAGPAGSREGQTVSGSLVSSPPGGGATSSSFISDPSRPVRDSFAETAGPHDYRDLARRADVLVFETGPLTEVVEVVGSIKATIYLSTDKPDTDLWVKVYDVAPDGTAFNLMSPGLDVIRASYRDKQPKRSLLQPGQVYSLELGNLLTANRFLRGHRIRIALMASFAPHMSRNLHNGLLEMVSDKAETARVTIHHSRDYPSRIELSTMPAGSE